MRCLQKQLCGFAVMLFGVILAVIGLEFGYVLCLLAGAVGLYGLGMVFWNVEQTADEDTPEEG